MVIVRPRVAEITNNEHKEPAIHAGVFKALGILDEVGKHKVDMGLDTRTEISK